MITNQATFTGKTGKSEYARASLHDQSREQALVAAAQAGMTEAMDELLLRHRTALYRAARRFTRSHEDAEDLVQETMLRAFVNVRRFRQESQFATWLMAIVNNAARSMKRKGRNTFLFLSTARTKSQPACIAGIFPMFATVQRRRPCNGNSSHFSALYFCGSRQYTRSCSNDVSSTKSALPTRHRLSDSQSVRQNRVFIERDAKSPIRLKDAVSLKDAISQNTRAR